MYMCTCVCVYLCIHYVCLCSWRGGEVKVYFFQQKYTDRTRKSVDGLPRHDRQSSPWERVKMLQNLFAGPRPSGGKKEGCGIALYRSEWYTIFPPNHSGRLQIKHSSVLVIQQIRYLIYRSHVHAYVYQRWLKSFRKFHCQEGNNNRVLGRADLAHTELDLSLNRKWHRTNFILKPPIHSSNFKFSFVWYSKVNMKSKACVCCVVKICVHTVSRFFWSTHHVQ